MTKLILLRHGETNKNLDNTLHSIDDDAELNETGILQIEEVAQELKDYLPDIVYSSREKRSLESARILTQALGIPMLELDNIHERNWGKFTGQPWSEVEKILNPMNLDERYNYLPPGGESWKEFEERLTHAVKEVVIENQDKVVLIVTHGGAIRALMPYLLGKPKEESFKYDPKNASFVVFEYENGLFKQLKSSLKNF